MTLIEFAKNIAYMTLACVIGSLLLPLIFWVIDGAEDPATYFMQGFIACMVMTWPGIFLYFILFDVWPSLRGQTHEQRLEEIFA